MIGTMPKARSGAIRPVMSEAGFPGFVPLADVEGGPDRAFARLNLNEAMHPPSPAAINAAQQALANSNRYPDDLGTDLRAALADHIGVDVDRLHLGCGSSELLVAAVQIAIAPGDHAIVPSPTFPVCAKRVVLADGRLTEVPVRADGSNDVGAMLAAITDDTRLFYVCTPNNPTGADLTASDLERVIAGVPDGCLLLIDEAYVEFAIAEGGVDAISLIGQRVGPWMITRTFSKAYCLSALRVGYAISSPGAVTQGLIQNRSSFSVSRPALAAASAALRDQDYMQNVLANTIAARQELAVGLNGLGCTVLPSRANFLTVRPHEVPAADLAQLARDAGILIQAMPWPDDKGSLRITVGTPPENQRLLDVLAPALSEHA